MRKLCFVAALLLSAMAISAAPYQHSVGGVVGGMNGFSYKGFVTDNLAIQADLAFGLTEAAGSVTTRTKVNGEKQKNTNSIEGHRGVWDFTANPNLEYQMEIGKGFSFFAGGGLSLGMAKQFSATYQGVRVTIDANEEDNKLMGKFGVNAIAGVEYQFDNVPLVLGFDFRPGYGLAFRTEKHNDVTGSMCFNYFDWKMAFAVRYCF